MARPMADRCGMRVKSGLKAGAITCYDDSSGYLVPVITPCSTPTYPPTPVPPTPSGVQWLSCQSCTGTRLSNGGLQDAVCEVCYM
jgi:hypothetical protein